MSPRTALRTLDLATRPENISRLSRVDFGNIEMALRSLDAVLPKEAEPVDSAVAVVPPATPKVPKVPVDKKQ